MQNIYFFIPVRFGSVVENSDFVRNKFGLVLFGLVWFKKRGLVRIL